MAKLKGEIRNPFVAQMGDCTFIIRYFADHQLHIFTCRSDKSLNWMQRFDGTPPTEQEEFLNQNTNQLVSTMVSVWEIVSKIGEFKPECGEHHFDSVGEFPRMPQEIQRTTWTSILKQVSSEATDAIASAQTEAELRAIKGKYDKLMLEIFKAAYAKSS